jgi:hypothetical protein
MRKINWIAVLAVGVCACAAPLIGIVVWLWATVSPGTNWQMVSALGTWAAATAAACIGVLALRTARRVAWFTGSTESYNMKQLQLAAKRDNVRLIWWDPSIRPWPFDGQHGEEVKTETIYLGIPLDRRRGKGKAPLE